MPEGNRLPGVELEALLGELARHVIGQGQVHVVAADQKVVAHGQPLQHEVARFLGHAHERQIGRTAAHVAHQKLVAELQLAPPTIADVRQPRVDRRLGLFEKDHALGQAGGQGRLAGQFARAGVKRRRHGQHDDLFFQGGIGKRRVPGADQVLQIPLRRGDRRDLGDFGRGVPGQDRLAAIDPAVRQP